MNTGNQNDCWTDKSTAELITNNPEWCISFKEFNGSDSVIAAEKELLQVIGSGTIEVLLVVDIEKRRIVHLNNVWYVQKIPRSGEVCFWYWQLTMQIERAFSIRQASVEKCKFKVQDKVVFAMKVKRCTKSLYGSYNPRIACRSEFYHIKIFLTIAVSQTLGT